MIEKNWLKIGEMARALGVSAKELRYWEQVVPEIRPRRSKGNLRYYHRGELPRLARIRDWLAEGLTVADCRQLLLTGELKQGLGFELEAAPAAAPAAAPSRSRGPKPMTASLAKVRDALAELLDRLGPTPPPAKRARKAPGAGAEAVPVPGPDDAHEDARLTEARVRPRSAAAPPAAPPDPEPPKAPKPRKKPPAPPADPDSFGPLFEGV